MTDLKYSEILRLNKIMGQDLAVAPNYTVKILSNVITSQFNEIFEFVLRKEGINARSSTGDYDNIVQDCEKFAASDTILIFWELANLIDGLQYKADVMAEEEVQNLIEKVKGEIDFVFQALHAASNVILNKFSSIVFNHSFLRKNRFERIGEELNAYVEKKLPANFTIIDIDKVIAKVSIDKSVDFRYYYSSKSLYTIEFYKEYCKYVAPILLSLVGKSKKALIFDCDNTLWKGIVGEDGVEGVELSAKSKNGIAYEEIHFLAKALSKQGIMLGLCSKNNLEDVEEVFAKRSDFILKIDDISAKKINWNDKVTSLTEIASELNIGVNALVFVDDSNFEVNYVNENLEGITVLKVPEQLYTYPAYIREKSNLFYKKELTEEDKKRGTLYKVENQRQVERNKFSSIDHYLRSLKLELNVFVNDQAHLERVAQLTQKTNQFNLTTIRYTEAIVRQFMDKDKAKVYDFSLTDKFGDYGITGVALVEIKGKVATIETFLMSCRVIGRNVEIAFLNYILEDLKLNNVQTVLSSYSKTNKNAQVESFYDDFGFDLLQTVNNFKSYSLDLTKYSAKVIDYIKVNTN